MRIAHHGHRRTLVALALGALMAGRVRATRAAEAELAAPRSTGLTQEWIGLELTPVSLALPDPPPNGDGHTDAFQAGPGGSLRLFRHRWQHAYITPIQAGLYVSTAGTQTIFAQLQTEGGVIVPWTDRRFELGMGAGLGILAMSYSSHCDGTCNLGGAGWMISLVGRYLFVTAPTWTVGATLRFVAPLSKPDSEWFGYYVGGGNMLLGGVEFAYGRGS